MPAREGTGSVSPRRTLLDASSDDHVALRASEARYRRLFEAAQDGILLLDARDGKIIDVNPFMVAMLGYPHAQFLGKELWEIGLFKDVAAARAAFVELTTNGYIRYEHLPLKTADGHQVDVEFVSNLYMVDDVQVIQCNIRNITAHKRAEDVLRESQRLAFNLVAHLPHRILVKDTASVIQFCNANYARDVGLEPEAIVGKDAFDFYPRVIAEAQNADDREVMALDVVKDVVEPHRVGEQERWVHTIKVPYRDQGGAIVGVLALMEDVTERRQLEDELRQSQKLEGLGLLAGGVAHDFNNMLTGVLGYCDLFSTRLRPDDPLAGDIAQIRKCGERATVLTRQLLAFSRKQVLELNVLDVNGLVSDLFGMLERLIGEQIELKSAFATDAGRVRADYGQLQQVLLNLVVNARDAMPDGGRVTITTRNVALDANNAGRGLDLDMGEYVTLAVTDNGSGMDDDAKRRIFEPFFSTKQMGKGLGLGLATVYGIVKQSGGDIGCESRPGSGTTFTVYLPRVEAEVEAVISKAFMPAVGGSETLLVAEDEDLVRELITDVLTLSGYKVIATRNGPEAIRAYEHCGGAVDLLVTDMIMPNMNGVELMKRLTEIRPGIKVLFMSGYSGESLTHQSMIEEGIAYLQKPFSLESLNRGVRDVLDS
jgi:PAS domain S-box-containing protein